jgi:CBS domain-containing protein
LNVELPADAGAILITRTTIDGIVARTVDINLLSYESSKWGCQIRLKAYFCYMPLNKVSVSILLSEKSSSVFCVAEDMTIDYAVSEMNRQRIGSIVVKKNDQVCGIFTERDILTRVVSAGRDPKSTLVREVMTESYQWIKPDTSVEDAMQLMTDKRVRHLPVIDDGRLVGMISIGDVTRWLLKVNEMEAENLRRYVFSEYPG